MKGAIVVNEERCKGCCLCVSACPLHILDLSADKVNTRGYQFATQTNADACTGCSSCAIVCPDACITVYRARS
ncbi:MAG: 4Fe-4S binding protein [Bacteroidaceae bacterium]|nr:4Fe-4S binding protein [Bacteroidaceae bacterium]